MNSMCYNSGVQVQYGVSKLYNTRATSIVTRRAEPTRVVEEAGDDQR